MIDSELEVSRWYMLGLSAVDAKQLIGHIPGTLNYGQLVSWTKLPETAKDIVRKAFAEGKS